MLETPCARFEPGTIGDKVIWGPSPRPHPTPVTPRGGDCTSVEHVGSTRLHSHLSSLNCPLHVEATVSWSPSSVFHPEYNCKLDEESVDGKNQAESSLRSPRCRFCSLALGLQDLGRRTWYSS